MTAPLRRGPGWLRPVVSIIGMLAVFYAVPVQEHASTARTAMAVLATLAGIAVLGWAIAGQVRRQIADPDASLNSLFMLLGLVAVFFALAYFVLEVASPGQMAGLSTRTDALYFTLATLSTVGYGDVHAEESLARGLVSIQLAFDIVFVAALIGTLTGRVRARVSAPSEDGGAA